ncbi:MAG TPA: type IV pilus biogenesis/stability protein PilW [Leucothrix sp.]|nr:type IV pilus biogenesis/stability protein PilW [Leucothrix sp.]
MSTVININNKSIPSLVSVLLITVSLVGCNGIGTKDPKAADYNSELGIRYLQQGRLKLANDKLLKSLEQNPNSAQSNHYYALLQERLEQPIKATKYFEKAIRIAPKNPELRNNYGSFLCKNSRPQAAVKQFLTAVKDPLYSTPEFAYANAAICLRKVNSANPQAEKYFRLALKKSPSFPSALLGMASIYKDQGNYSKAQAFMLRYESVGKSTPEALKLCTIINTKTKNHAKASSCQSALLRLFPSSPEAEQISKSL